jgi:hypothetical protein
MKVKHKRRHKKWILEQSLHKMADRRRNGKKKHIKAVKRSMNKIRKTYHRKWLIFWENTENPVSWSDCINYKIKWRICHRMQHKILPVWIPVKSTTKVMLLPRCSSYRVCS